MSESLPRVSVIIPHYNMHSHLPSAVESVVDQDYKNIELIVVDDGSDQKVNPDSYSSYDLPITFHEMSHTGKSKAVNRGFEVATGDFITILDADDQLPPQSISSRIIRIQKAQADLCMGSFQVCYNNEVQTVRSIKEYISRSNEKLIQDVLTKIISPIHQNTMLFSKGLLEKIGRMDVQMLRGQDKDFAIKLLQQSQKVVHVQEPVYRYNRYHRPINRRIKNRVLGARYKLQVIRRYAKKSQSVLFLMWGAIVELAKLIHDLFGIYKK